MSNKYSRDDFGIYFHIPFCRSICRYCDFVKSARFDAKLLDAYVENLNSLCLSYLNKLQIKPGSVSSVYFGGGTPSLLGIELKPLLDVLHPYLKRDAEISLETNPEDLTCDKLNLWKNIGVNRLSIGIQTFDEIGLQFLTRQHSKHDSIEAVGRASGYFQNINLDLIYGWQNQSRRSWQKDLEIAIDLSVPHLSLYNLTYEAKTALGQMLKKGATKATNDDELYYLYNQARKYLGKHGFSHEEISNWTKPGFSCRHNWLYWQALPFIGVGSGAHGFLADEGAFGLRYSYPAQVGKFLNSQSIDTSSLPSLIESSGALLEERDATAWIYEYVGCGLRCNEGIDLALVGTATGLSFQPNAICKEGIKRGLLQLTRDDRLLLDETQWFRETSWSLEVAMSFEKIN